MRIIDVWESEDDFRTFDQSTLPPLLATHARPDLGRPVTRELHVRNVVRGAEEGHLDG